MIIKNAIKTRVPEQTLVELLDGHWNILMLLDAQQKQAKKMYEAAKAAGTYSAAERLQLELISTATERLVTEHKWLGNSMRRASDKLDDKVWDDEDERQREEQLLLDLWYRYEA
jgi:hypothetical protein